MSRPEKYNIFTYFLIIEEILRKSYNTYGDIEEKRMTKYVQQENIMQFLNLLKILNFFNSVH